MVLACGIAYACYRVKLGGFWPLAWLDLTFVVLEAIFFITSRDCLRKYFTRSQQLLASDAASRPLAPAPIRRRRERHPTDHENPAPTEGGRGKGL